MFYEIGDMNAKIEASEKISGWNFITNKIEEIFDLKKAAMRLFLTFKKFLSNDNKCNKSPESRTGASFFKKDIPYPRKIYDHKPLSNINRTTSK